MSSSTAKKQFEAANDIRPTSDSMWKALDPAKRKALEKEKPWNSDPKYFKSVRMSALALIKIVMHAKTGQGKAGVITTDKGNWIEVMGLLQGFFADNEFIIMDSFALPVDATEVECNLSEDAMRYMVEYIKHSETLGKKEYAVGWYHSHPGYSCFLSGIDVNTQTINQTYNDPWLAIVIDPVQTIATGRVEMKAFRTYPENFKGEGMTDMHGVPAGKIEEFGVHGNRYYEVPISYFRSEEDAVQLDLLWTKYWAKTLSTSPLVSNRFYTDTQVSDVASRLAKCEGEMTTGRAVTTGGSSVSARDKKESNLQLVQKDIGKVSGEVLQGLLGMVVKNEVFNTRQ